MTFLSTLAVDFVSSTHIANLILAKPRTLCSEDANERRRILERWWYRVRKSLSVVAKSATTSLKKAARKVQRFSNENANSLEENSTISQDDTIILISRNKKPTSEDFANAKNQSPESANEPTESASSLGRQDWQNDPREVHIARQADDAICKYQQRVKMLSTAARSRSKAYIRQLLRSGEVTFDEILLAIRNVQKQQEHLEPCYRTNACEIFKHRANLEPWLEQDWIYRSKCLNDTGVIRASNVSKDAQEPVSCEPVNEPARCEVVERKPSKRDCVESEEICERKAVHVAAAEQKLAREPRNAPQTMRQISPNAWVNVRKQDTCRSIGDLLTQP